MSSPVKPIDEHTGDSWRTTRLRQDDADRVARVAVAILHNEVNRAEWRSIVVQKGSLTLRHKSDPHKVIKIFIDHGARLWTRIGFADAPRREDPLVVGIELTALDSDERTVLRDQLRRRFKYYADPRSVPYSKWMLKPNMDHVYDLLVLRPGQPCLEVNEEEVWLLEQRIKKQLQMIE